MSRPVIYGFAPAFGFETSGPFTLKLLTWCRLNGIDYTFRVENNAAKGPHGKSPWAEIDGQLVADSDVIISALAEPRGLSPHAVDTPEAAAGRAWKMAIEEGMHQIYEHELIMREDGAAWFRSMLAEQLPAPVSALLYRVLRRKLARQLHARGMIRLGDAQMAAQGQNLFDALEVWLSAQPFVDGDAPGLGDASVYGMLAPMLRWPMRGPVAVHARGLTALRDWEARIAARCGYAAAG